MAHWSRLEASQAKEVLVDLERPDSDEEDARAAKRKKGLKGERGEPGPQGLRGPPGTNTNTSPGLSLSFDQLMQMQQNMGSIMIAMLQANNKETVTHWNKPVKPKFF